MAEAIADSTQSTGCGEEPSRLLAVLGVLDDSIARDIIRTLDTISGSMTAQELSESCGISLTSIYRKLDRLTDAGLVEKTAEVDDDGHRRHRFSLVVDHVEVSLGADSAFDVQLYREAA